MLPTKFLIKLIIIISFFIIICDTFKLNFNREIKDKIDIHADDIAKIKKKFKFTKQQKDKILDVSDYNSEDIITDIDDADKNRPSDGSFTMTTSKFQKQEIKTNENEKSVNVKFKKESDGKINDKEENIEKLDQQMKDKLQEDGKVKKQPKKNVPNPNVANTIQEQISKSTSSQKERIIVKELYIPIIDASEKNEIKNDSDKNEKLINKTVSINSTLQNLKIQEDFSKTGEAKIKAELEHKIESTEKQKFKKNVVSKNETTKSNQSSQDKKIVAASKKNTIDQNQQEKQKSDKDVIQKTEDQYQYNTPISDSMKERNISNKVESNKNKKSDETESEGNVEQEQFNVLYRSLPSFAPNYNIVKNEKCQREGQIFLRQLRGHKLWALQMLDASAKLPSGILRGNLNQLGDFDACLDAFARVKVNQDKPAVPVRGKYCLAEIDFAAVAEGARFPVHLLQARNFIRSNRKDAGHFIPKFTTINWAICLPSACTYQDAEDILLDAIAPYNLTTGVKISLDVKEDMCYTKRHMEWWRHSYETLAALGFYILVVTIACVATLKDCWQFKTDVAIDKANDNDSNAKYETQQKDGTLHKIFMSFSIKRSCEELLSTKSSESDIQCIHGIRALTTIILYSAHKLLPIARIPFSNRTFLTEIANSQWSVFLRVSLIYTDTFLLLSGVLSAYHMSKDMMHKGEIQWFRRLITRYIRLTPALSAVLLFYAYIWDHIGTGPQWSNVVTANAQLCRNNMWTNLLYIQNFFPFEEMCATHTHQLALDMQLAILAPILVWFLYKAPIWGLALLGGLHSISVGLRYFSAINHRLSLVIFHGISHSQLMRTANFSYANALHRATPYLTGIGLGVLLKNTEKDMRLPKVILALGWMGALYFFGWTFNAPAHLSKRDYQYDVQEAAQLSASLSVAWSLALSWLIFACHTNNGGSINSFLCSRPLILLSKISYAIYLVQFVIFFYNVGTYRSSTVFDVTQSFNVLEFVSVIIASIIVTLLFDTPMQTIKNIIIKKCCGTHKIEIEQIVEVDSNSKKLEERLIYQDYIDNPQDTSYSYFSNDIYDADDQGNIYERQDSQESHDGYPISEKYQSSENDPISEEGYDPEHDLDEYEYNDEMNEDVTEPASEKDIEPDDSDLKDWEWTENNKESKEES